MREAALEVVRRLRHAGHEAYLVGGCVRDLLLEIEPEDWDVATSARPEEARPLFDRARQVGRSFGVLQVHVDGVWIEVATFRSEGPYSDGRHPDAVQFTDAENDALRRDFTINALLLDPDSGVVLDFVAGRRDLEDRVLRSVGNPESRFAEDALRLLRAVRFACRFDLRIEPRTWEAMRSNAARIVAVSPERSAEELLAILGGPRPRRGMELLHESGLLSHLAPEVARLHGVQQSPRHHPEGDVWEHTLRMLDLLPGGDPLLALGVLLHDVGKPDTGSQSGGDIRFIGHEEKGQGIAAAFMQRLRLPARTQETVLALIAQHLRFLDAARMRASTRRRFVLQDHFPLLLELHRLDALASNGDLAAWELCRRELEDLRSEPQPLRPFLDGRQLGALGYAPGPRLGSILRALVDAQLEGEVGDAESARAWVQARFAPDAPPAAPSSGTAPREAP